MVKISAKEWGGGDNFVRPWGILNFHLHLRGVWGGRLSQMRF